MSTWCNPLAVHAPLMHRVFVLIHDHPSLVITGDSEVTVNKDGRWWMRKRERWIHNSEVTVKSLWRKGWNLKRGQRRWQWEAIWIWKWSTISFGKWCKGSHQCVRKNPHNPRHGHGWCAGGDISAQGRAQKHPGHIPAWVAPPVIFPRATSLARMKMQLICVLWLALRRVSIRAQTAPCLGSWNTWGWPVCVGKCCCAQVPSQCENTQVEVGLGYNSQVSQDVAEDGRLEYGECCQIGKLWWSAAK